MRRPSSLSGQSHIEATIRRRISQYEEPDPERFDDLSRWADAELGPLMDRIALECISWEMMILGSGQRRAKVCLGARGVLQRLSRSSLSGAAFRSSLHPWPSDQRIVPGMARVSTTRDDEDLAARIVAKAIAAMPIRVRRAAAPGCRSTVTMRGEGG